jgi:hypothetical protein
MADWRRPGGYAPNPGNLGPELMREQQEAIDEAEQEAQRRIEAEHTGKRPRWKRFLYWSRLVQALRLAGAAGLMKIPDAARAMKSPYPSATTRARRRSLNTTS